MKKKEPFQAVKFNFFLQNNATKTNYNWQHLRDKKRVQEKQQVAGPTTLCW